MKQPVRFLHESAATEFDVRDTLIRLRDVLAGTNIESDLRDDIQIAVAEVLNNVVEHAYHGVANQGVETKGEFSDKRIRVIVSDGGKPMPGLSIPKLAKAPLNVDIRDLPEGGFGWALVAALTRQAHYRRRQGRNIVTLEFPLRAQQVGHP